VTEPARIGVLASGGGSNLTALLAHLDTLANGPVVGVVLSNKPGAGALDKAMARGIPAHVLGDPANGDSLLGVLETYGVTTIALAGYLKFVPETVTRAFRGRLVNVHPALLPAFGGHGMYGIRVHAAVLAAGARVSGVTVHFVDEHYDHGATIAQWPVPVAPDDSPESLAARVLRAEHALFPRCVAGVASGRITLDAAGHVHGLGRALSLDAAFTSGAAEGPALGAAMDSLLFSNT
jgi:formyltetrahydrofolate-dependent phosphoribosylglycinamide formyltransferase